VNLQMGSQIFFDVNIPLLWGTRAVVQDRDRHLSVIDLSGEKARVEILADHPAPKSRYTLTFEGFFTILSRSGDELYSYSPDEKKLTNSALDLPDVQILSDAIKIGTNVFSNNTIIGSAVGIAVTATGFSMAAPLPPNLAELVV
jgi:hypothetical protein